MLWRVAAVTPNLTRRRLVISLIMPLLLYCDVVWSSMGNVLMRRLNVLFNNCTRYVYGLRRFDHICQFRSAILGTTINGYLKCKYLFFFYRIVISGSPGYIIENILPAHSLRTRNFVVPFGLCRIRRRSFLIMAISIWNTLPLYIKNSNNFRTFKRFCLEY